MNETKLKKIVTRLLVFFIGIPLVLLLVHFSHFNFILLHITILVLSIIATNELHKIFQTKYPLQSKTLLIILNALFPITSFSINFTYLKTDCIPLLLVFSVFIILIYEIFYQKYENEQLFENSCSRIAYSTFIVFYIGFLSSYITKICYTPYPKEYLYIFLGMVFACDSLAWFFGMLFGKNNRGFILASPNKSITGFLGGIFGSILVAFLGKYLFPQAFNSSALKIFIFGIILSCASIIGDLAESVLKRSSNTKDSGQVIPGRGGILDSIDSILITAPFYYYLIQLFFGA